jgi:hypothetical protein
MYWLRTFQLLDLVGFLLLCTLWASGGWLLVTHCFHLRPNERVLAGLAAGFLLFVTLGNLLANLLNLTGAFWVAGGMILLGGLLAMVRSTVRPRLPWADFLSWKPLLALVLVTFLFALIQRGLAIFDEFVHMPLVSTMAAGNIPPHFYLDPGVSFTYHYGLQVFAAGLVRMANFTPWSAFDLSKALAIGFTAVLGWLWVYRKTHSRLAAGAGGFALIFAAGTRWLLLLLPNTILLWLGQAVTPINTGLTSGASLVEVLTSSWVIEGGGPVPFPFAFHNGIILPVYFVLGATGAMPFMTVILLLLLGRFSYRSLLAGITILFLIGSLALSAEHIFALLWLGLALVLVYQLVVYHKNRSPDKAHQLIFWSLVLVASAILSVLQGGFITEFVRSLIAGLQGANATQTNYHGFSLRWPPAIPTAHFADLHIFNLRQLLVLLAELGPLLLLAPLGSWYAWKRTRQRDWLSGALGIAALASILFTLFVRYGLDRSSTRLPATSLWLWLLLAIPPLWFVYRKGRPAVQRLIQVGYGLAIFGGLVIFAIQLIAIPSPQLTYFINGMDARMSSLYWDMLPKGAQILDDTAYRSVTIFGRPTRAYSDIYDPYPDWEALIAAPDPFQAAREGYDFVYMDAKWWKKLPAEIQRTYQQEPVVLLQELTNDQDFRRLYDIRGLLNSPPP